MKKELAAERKRSSTLEAENKALKAEMKKMQKDLRKIEKEVEELELEKKTKDAKPSLSFDCHLCGKTLKDDDLRLHARTHEMTETEFHISRESPDNVPGLPMDLNFF